MLTHLLAQSYSNTTTLDSSSSSLGVVPALIWLAVAVLSIVAFWRLYSKAGQPGWASIIPIYNIYVLLKIAGRPGWWTILSFIPFVNIVIFIIVGMDVAKRFGYGEVFGLLVCGLLGIGYWIIGLSGAQYQGGSDGSVGPVPGGPVQTPPTQTPPTAPTSTPPTAGTPPQVQ